MAASSAAGAVLSAVTPARGVGAVDALGDLPSALAPAVRAATLLGDPLLLLAVAALVYWRAPPAVAARPRRAGALLLALGLAAAAVTVALKSAFALPRPPGAAESGFGFPSGHAAGATAVYVGAARAFDGLDRRRRVVVASVLVALVALSRVALSVHYLVDVVAGIAVGLGLVAVVAGPSAGFLAAAGVGLLGVSIAAPAMAAETATVAGGSLGAGLAWAVTDGVGDRPVPPVAVVPAAVVAAPAATVDSLPITPPLSGALGLALGAAVVLLPAVVERTENIG